MNRQVLHPTATTLSTNRFLSGEDADSVQGWDFCWFLVLDHHGVVPPGLLNPHICSNHTLSHPHPVCKDTVTPLSPEMAMFAGTTLLSFVSKGWNHPFLNSHDNLHITTPLNVTLITVTAQLMPFPSFSEDEIKHRGEGGRSKASHLQRNAWRRRGGGVATQFAIS